MPGTETAPRPTGTNDHYTVDSMRRIYGNQDASIEIERVKVQRHQPVSPSNLHWPQMNQTRAVVPVSWSHLPPERRPPPRKHRKNKLNNELVRAMPPPNSCHNQCFPSPFMPYFPYPYPYPYFNYMWPPPTQSWPPMIQTWDQEMHNSLQTDENHIKNVGSLPTSPESHKLESSSNRDSISPVMGQPMPSSTQTSQVPMLVTTGTAQTTSISVDGHCKNTMEKTCAEGLQSQDRVGMQLDNKIEKIDDDSVSDKSSFTSATSNIPSPPRRRAKENNRFHNSLSQNIQKEERHSEHLRSDLNNAFKNFEKSVDIFKTQLTLDGSSIGIALPSENGQAKTSLIAASKFKETIGEINVQESKVEEDHRSSTASFHSMKNASDVVLADTDSTDIFLPTDTTTGDEVGNFLRQLLYCSVLFAMHDFSQQQMLFKITSIDMHFFIKAIAKRKFSLIKQCSIKHLN